MLPLTQPTASKYQRKPKCVTQNPLKRFRVKTVKQNGGTPTVAPCQCHSVSRQNVRCSGSVHCTAKRKRYRQSRETTPTLPSATPESPPPLHGRRVPQSTLRTLHSSTHVLSIITTAPQFNHHAQLGRLQCNHLPSSVTPIQSKIRLKTEHLEHCLDYQQKIVSFRFSLRTVRH